MNGKGIFSNESANRRYYEKGCLHFHHSCMLGDVVQILVNKKVGGLTIIDDDRHVVGFISDGDIMRAVARQKTRSIFSGNDSIMVLYDADTFDEKVSEFKRRNVMELATRKVFCVMSSKPLDEVADILAKKKFKKIPITDKDGTLLGVARRAMIMRYIFATLFGIEPEVREDQPEIE